MDDFTQWDTEKRNIIPDIKKEKIYNSKRRTVCLERMTNDIYRRAFSETRLMDCVDELKTGYSYNFITAGDVDAMSYIKLVLRHVKKLDYMLLSTWCMAFEDVFQIQEWLDDGTIKKIDAYVGEIFPSSYKKEYEMLVPVIKKYGGRVGVFKNHSKIFAGYNLDNDVYFGIQTSANINTNPRTEQGCITMSRDIYEFYKEYFDGIFSFLKN
jgi:hypothetical protein